MKFLRTLLADLRDRQILPAMVLLTLLAIAIPVGASILLRKTTMQSAPTQVPRAVTPAKGLPAPATELSVLNGTPVKSVTRKGAEPNPFEEPVAATSPGSSSNTTTTPVKTTPVKTTPVKTTPAKTTPVKTTPVKTTPVKTTPVKTTPTRTTTTQTKTHTTTTRTHTTTTPASTHPKAPAPTLATPSVGPPFLKARQAYVTTLDTSDAKGTHVLSGIVRRAPLPAARSPKIIFLGVLEGGKKAVFLFVNTVHVDGASKIGKACLPSPGDCQIIELAPGQGIKLAPIPNSRVMASFTFTVGSIGVSNYPNAAAAKAARDALSSAGTALLPMSTSTELGAFHFDDSIGALVPQRPPSSGTTGTTAVTGSSDSSGSTGLTGPTGLTAGASGSSAGTAVTSNEVAGGVRFVLAPAS